MIGTCIQRDRRSGEDNITFNLNEIRFRMRSELNWLLMVSNSGLW